VLCARTGERKSKRARKGRGPMTVSSTTKLGEVKLRLIEVLGLHPSNAALYVRGSLVEGDDSTMAGERHAAVLSESVSGAPALLYGGRDRILRRTLHSVETACRPWLCDAHARSVQWCYLCARVL